MCVNVCVCVYVCVSVSVCMHVSVSVYCKCRYFRAAKFLHIKPLVTFLRGLVFKHLVINSI